MAVNMHPKGDSTEIMTMAQLKPMLTAQELVDHLKSKGVKFELMGEDEARRYLAEKSYYFKAASYRRLFPK